MQRSQRRKRKKSSSLRSSASFAPLWFNRFRPSSADDFDVVLAAVEVPPGLRTFGEDGVERLNVLHAAILQPALEALRATFGVLRDAVLPGGAAAEDAGEGRPRLGGEQQCLAEDFV